MKRIRKELKNTGLDWDIEKGKKHYKLKLEGRLVGILPKANVSQKTSENIRAFMNVRAQIRRNAEEIKAERARAKKTKRK